MAKDKSKKVTAKTVDFSNVKDRGSLNIKHLPEGDYPARVKSVQDHESKSGNFNWLFEIEVTGNANGAKSKGAVYPYYCGVGSDELWKVRNLFIACGMNVPKKKVAVDPSKAVGKTLGITLEDDEYDGKMKSVIASTIPLSEVVENDEDDGDAEDETPPSSTKTKEKKGKKSKAEPEPEPEPKKGKKDKAGKKGKKSKGTVTEDELEELEVDEL